MAYKQYIGARYVTKFYQNTQEPSSAAWEANVKYEPLTVVTVGGTSYVSKKEVPATVGNPQTNPEYWLKTADYNEQVARLEKRLNATRRAGNVSELVTSNDYEVGDIVFVQGYYAAGDGGDGTFEVANAPSGFSHALQGGLYANNIDDDYKLPRYGGRYVDEMVDNLRPFLPLHSGFKHIILPQPNDKHPACRHTPEQGQENYFWVTYNPIVYDEHYAYTVNDFSGQIMLDKDSPNRECVFKISDTRKPEDIYFNNLFVEGWHVGDTLVLPDHAVLIEGCARFNVDNLLAGYAHNALTLGGNSAKNPIEILANYCELGSCDQKVINCNNPYTTILRFNTLQVQNVFPEATHGIYASSGAYKWHIGEYSIGFKVGTSPTDFTPVYFNCVGYNTLDLGIDIGRARIGAAGKGKLIELAGNRGIHTIGVLRSSGATDEISVSGVANALHISDLVRPQLSDAVILTTNGSYASITIDKMYAGLVTKTGNNITVNGVCSGTLETVFGYGLILNETTQKFVYRYNGNNYPIN